MSLKAKIFTSLTVSAFFALTALVFAPSQIYLTNAIDFGTDYFLLLGYLFMIALPVFLLLAILTTLSAKYFTAHQKIIVLILSISFLLWLQGNILVWDYGLLDGSKIEFNNYFVAFDAVVWIAIIVVTLIKSSFLYKHTKIISAGFIVIQLISTTVLAYNHPEAFNPSRYQIDTTNEFTFSKDKNVIILVLDAFESDVFQQVIDEDESYRTIFDGFTYFRDGMAGEPITRTSVPNIMTGQYYDNSIKFSDFLKQAYFSNNSIPKVLKQENFEVDCFPYYPNLVYQDPSILSNLVESTSVKNSTLIDIYDSTLFRYLPDLVKKYIYNDGRWFLQNMISDQPAVSTSGNITRYLTDGQQITFSERALELYDVALINRMMTYSNVVGGRNIFKMYWLHGDHMPYLLNEKLEYEDMGDYGYERQAKGSLQIVKIFLDELKSLGVFDNSMIFIIGDHGLGIFGEAIQNRANPLFLVKRFSDQGPITISDAPVSLSDIPKTIFSELGLKGDFTGESVFDVNESESRERRFLYYKNNNETVMNEYIVTGPVHSSYSWHFTGNEYVYAPAGEPSQEIYPIVLGNEINIIKSDSNAESDAEKADFTFRFGPGWGDSESTHRWTVSSLAVSIITTDSENVSASLLLQYKPLKEDNSLSIYLNGVKIMDCDSNSECKIDKLTFKKGKNILEFKAKLPAVRPSNNDLRTLCYSFSTITFSKYVYVPAAEPSQEIFPIVLDNGPNIIKSNPVALSYIKNADFTFQFGSGWGDSESTHRWTVSSLAVSIITTDSENVSASLFLQYEPLKEDNSLSVYLNGVKIMDCDSNSECNIDKLTFKKGKNILEFKAKLPAATPSNNDSRTLCYSFYTITFGIPKN